MKLQVGVKALVQNDEGFYLLLQRSDPLPDGSGIRWDIPGGRIEPSESLEDGLRREVLEEIGVEVMAQPELIAAQDMFVDEIDVHVVRLTYRVVWDGTVRLGDQHRQYKWVSLDEALALELDPYLRGVLRAE